MSKIKKNNIITLSIITLVGFILRIYNLSSDSYWLDESYSISVAQAILKHGYPLLDSGIIYYHEIFNNYLIAFNSLIFEESAFAYRLSSVIFGTATIVIVYLLAKKLFNNKIGLLSAFFIAIANWQILWSRQAKGYAGLQFFYLLSSYFLLKLWERFNKRDYLFFFISSVLAWSCHDLGAIMLPLGTLILIVKHWHKIKKKFTDSSLLRRYIVATTGLLLVVSFIITNHELLRAMISKHDWVADFYIIFLFKYHLFIIIGAVVGLAYLYFKKKKNTFFFILFFWLLPLLVTINVTDLVQFRYIFHFYPMMIILTVYLISHIIKVFKGELQQSIMLLLLLILPNLSMLVFLPKAHYPLEPLTPQPNFKQAYEEINKIKKPTDIIISPYTCLDKIYFGKTNYWIKISFSNKLEELDNYTNYPYDIYHKTPLLNNFKELQEITNTQHGFILIDGMAHSRLGSEFLNNLSNNYTQVLFQDGKRLNKLWVFGF